MNDIVTVICYKKSHQWIRSEAIRFYAEGVLCCDGSEKERYANVLAALISGRTVCSDE